MFCAKCGEQLSDEASFCSKCGNSTGISQIPNYANPTPQPVKIARTKPIILICVVSALIIIGIAAPSIMAIINNNNIFDDSPNITVEQMKRDLIENDVYIVTAWWEDLYHLRFAEFNFDRFEITKTLSEENTIYYYVNISGENYYSQKINAPFIVTYKKFKEGWAFTNIRYNGSI